MSLRSITWSEIEAATLSEYGIQPHVHSLLDEAGIAQGLRRCLGVAGPQPRRLLIDAVAEALVRAPGFKDKHHLIEEVADGLVARGDFIENWDVSSDSQQRRRLIYPASYSYVMVSSSRALLVGVPVDNRLPLSEDLRRRMKWQGLSCFVEGDATLRAALTTDGVREVALDNWLQAPQPESPGRLHDHLEMRLAAADRIVDSSQLRIIRQMETNSYYRGRWGAPTAESGVFVARRPQTYGSELWCVVALRAGSPIALADLPFRGTLFAAHDEAWRIQAALDRLAGNPQRARITRGPLQHAVDLFAPLPSWAVRRLEALGEWVDRAPGALFSLHIRAEDMDHVIEFLEDHLWMEMIDAD